MLKPSLSDGGLHLARLTSTGPASNSAYAVHIEQNIPAVEIRHAYDDFGPRAAFPCCQAADVVSALGSAHGGVINALCDIGLAKTTRSGFAPVSFPATERNLSTLRGIVAALCELPSARSHVMAGRRETIASIDRGGSIAIASPYLGIVSDDSNGGASHAHIGLFGSRTKRDTPGVRSKLATFEGLLDLMAGGKPSAESENRDAPLTMNGVDIGEWHALARAIAIACPQIASSIRSGRAVKAVLVSQTTRKPCSIHFIETVHTAVGRRDLEINLEGRFRELIDLLCLRPIAAGHRSSMVLGSGSPFPMPTRASGFSILAHPIVTDVATEHQSTTLRAATIAATMSKAKVEAARHAVQAAFESFALSDGRSVQ